MRFQCPYCRNVVGVDNTDLGLDVQCGHCSEIVTVPSSRVSSGCLIADFIVQEELGRGGMGIVYLAHQISLDRLSALKVLAEQYANDAEFVVGFIKEARAAAKLNHPHIVQAYAVGEDEGVFYFAMENVEGETMKEVQKREKIVSVDKAVVVIQQIAEALDYAWKEAKLVHRDIKPDNIMMTKKGSAKLADLGLARVAGDIDDSESEEVMGTPQYISPEHLTGAPMDVRSDIYSLGATFYHMVTGRFAFEGKSATEIAKKHLQAPLVPPIKVNPKIPQDVSDIIMKMMEKNPKNRYQEAEELVDDLRIARRRKGTVSASKKGPSTKSNKFKMTGTASKIPKTGSQTKTKVKTRTKTKTNIGGTGSHSKNLRALDVKREAESKKKLIIAGAVGMITLVGVASFLLISSSNDSSKKNSKKNTKVVQKPKKKRPTVIANKVTKLLKLKDSDKDAFLLSCREFFTTTNKPLDSKEQEAYTKLLTTFVAADETANLEKQRNEIRNQHIEQINEVKLTLESEKSKKLEQEEVIRERKNLKEKFAKLKEELDDKQVSAIDDFKERAEAKVETICYKFITSTKLNHYNEAIKDLKKSKQILIDKYKAIKEQFVKGNERLIKHFQFCINSTKSDTTKELLTDMLNEQKRDSKNSDMLDEVKDEKLKLYTDLISYADKVGELWNNLYDSRAALEGSQFEIKQSLAYIVSIDKNIITFKLSSKKIIKLSFKELSPKNLRRLLTKIADKSGMDEDTIFAYYLCNASLSCLQLAPDDSSKIIAYKIMLIYYGKLAKIESKAIKAGILRKIKYLREKFKSDFSDEAEEFLSKSNTDDEVDTEDSDLSDL